MHILHLSAVKNWGGGEHHIENLCSELALSNPEIKNTIFCVKEGAFHKRLQRTKLHYVTAKLSVKFAPSYFVKLGRMCKKENVDIIHIHDPSAIVLAILADKFFDLPPFIFSKKTSFPIKQRKKTLYKYNYPKIKRVLCVSNETKKVATAGIYNSESLLTIYHGTNLKTKSSETPFLLREKYNIDDSNIIIGNIANHIRAKHLDTWVNVANQIINVENKKNFFFMQMGTFTERTEALLQRVKELKLEKHMIFTGYVPNASNFLPQFDISLVTSQSEGIPQFIYESFYHKTPVISTNVGGIPEVIDDRINGLLAPMHDHMKLSEHVMQLASDLEQQERFVANAYEKLINMFTTKKMALETLKIYNEVVSKNK